jgi:DNA-directed RNA polymerase subunit RPC12/RpoP
LRKGTVIVGAVLLVVGLCLYGARVLIGGLLLALIGGLLLAFGALVVMLGMLPEITYNCPRCKQDIHQGTSRCPHCGYTITRAPRSPFESAGLMLRGKPYR